MTSIRSAPREQAISAGTAPLSQTAEYALRAMSYLAGRYSGPPVSAQDMADAVSVPSHYLSKVLRRLVEAGLLRSQKGHGGGFKLTRAPGQIHLSHVLDAVDELPAGNRCAFGWGNCDARSPCPLHPAWSRLKTALLDWAEGTSLADVADDCRSARGAGRRRQPAVPRRRSRS